MDKPSPEVMPLRPGIPLDPILQLWGGNLQPLPAVTFTGGNADPICLANPNRVALIVAPQVAWFEFGIVPAPGPAYVTFISQNSNIPLVIHCRDFPGATQSAWVGRGAAADVLSVWEYVLQPWWGR